MISTRGRYALRVMIDIAENSNGNFIPLNEIAERQGISEKYLESILVILTRGNLLLGMRGKGGGYKLIRDPKDYTLGTILRLTEGSLSPVACLKEGAEPCIKSPACRTLPVWKGLNDAINTYLDGITLAELLKPKASSSEYCI
ncbi:MAG: Rrf2 family transcriptional regulator [Lachnospiraceae bacterium]|nr:Rrf2 family transcriptional regulator [Lachnospiraceae bacterium]